MTAILILLWVITNTGMFLPCIVYIRIFLLDDST